MKISRLERRFGLWTTVSIISGAMIGSGIFMKPAVMAGELQSPILLLLVWLVAGVITMFGAMTNAEVAAMMPATGGQFIFFQKMYGDLFAFLYGWAAFAVFNTAGVASIAYVMAQYIEYFRILPRFPESIEKLYAVKLPLIGSIYPLEYIGLKVVTVSIVLLLTLANYASVRFGGLIQVAFTILKVVAIVFLIGGIFLSGEGFVGNFYQGGAGGPSMPDGTTLISAVMAATAGAFWAYDGWNNITFVAGEIRNPQQNIPRGLFIGITCVISVYVLLNLAFLYVLPIDVISSSSVVAAKAAQIVMGSFGGAFIAILVILSTFGSVNGNILATSRVTFAMSVEKQFFSFAGKVHPRYKTPGNALLLHGIWTSVLVFSGSFDMLTDMLIFISWLFYGMSAVGVFILRWKYPDIERPYRVLGYPILPVIFILFTTFFLVVTVYNDIADFTAGRSEVLKTGFGLALTLAGLPLYIYYKRKR